MKIYLTTRKVEEIEFDEDNFINYIKHNNPDDENIQNISSGKETYDSSEEELYDKWSYLSLNELFEDYYALFPYKIKKNTMVQNENCHINYEDAYQDMEWGLH